MQAIKMFERREIMMGRNNVLESGRHFIFLEPINVYEIRARFEGSEMAFIYYFGFSA